MMGRAFKPVAFLFSCISLMSCTAMVAQDVPRAAGAYAVPPNYRQLVARKIIEGTAHLGPIRSATISLPVERFVGLVNGGTRPVVCATTTTEGPVISQVTRWIIWFENGKIESAVANPGAIYCAGVLDAPFPEVVKRN